MTALRVHDTPAYLKTPDVFLVLVKPSGKRIVPDSDWHKTTQVSSLAKHPRFKDKNQQFFLLITHANDESCN